MELSFAIAALIQPEPRNVLEQDQPPCEIFGIWQAYARNSPVSANIIDLMVVGDLRVGAFERSVGLGDILEFPFSIPVVGNIGTKTLGEDSESRFDLGA